MTCVKIAFDKLSSYYQDGSIRQVPKEAVHPVLSTRKVRVKDLQNAQIVHALPIEFKGPNTIKGPRS